MIHMSRRAALLALVVLGAAACSGDDSLPGLANGTVTIADPPAGNTGTCAMDISGGRVEHPSGVGGIEAVNTDYWLSPEAKEIFGPTFYFVLKCRSDEATAEFIAGPNASVDTIAFGPGEYALTSEGGALNVVFSINNSNGNWSATNPGILHITQFDDRRIAGSFNFTVVDIGPEPNERNMLITGTFDFANPN